MEWDGGGAKGREGGKEGGKKSQCQTIGQRIRFKCLYPCTVTTEKLATSENDCVL